MTKVLQRRVAAPDTRVLELGCGDGDLLAEVAGIREGVDIDPAAIRRASSRHQQIRFVEGDALSFRSDERYDAIICDRLVHTITDVQRLLENASLHLAPRGRIYISCINPAWLAALGVTDAVRTAAGGAAGDRTPLTMLRGADLSALADLADLRVVAGEHGLLFPTASSSVVGSLANRVGAKLLVGRTLSMHRVYVLARRREKERAAPSVSVVVPARNEAGNIAAILARTPVMGTRTELLFVEGGSTDETWQTIRDEVARYTGPLEVRYSKQPGSGKGDAVRKGFADATGDVLMILDADLSVPPEELPKFSALLQSGRADYVQGTRLLYPMESDAMRPMNWLGNEAFGRLLTFMLDQRITDTLCGTKVLWASDYERIARARHVFGDLDPFGDFDLIFGAARLGLRISEIPVRYRRRTYGETNIHRFRAGWVLLKMSLLAGRSLKFV